jgi:hypothetical protein
MLSWPVVCSIFAKFLYPILGFKCTPISTLAHNWQRTKGEAPRIRDLSRFDPCSATRKGLAARGGLRRGPESDLEAQKMDNEAYTVREVARMTGYSMRTIVRMFENEPGVLVRENSKRRTLRIPRAVYERVVRKLTIR